MSAPKRIQRQRTRGWRMPEGAVYVGRPSVYGNPFPISGDWIMWTAVALGLRADAAGRREAAVRLHRLWMADITVLAEPETGAGGALEFSGGGVVTMEAQTRGIAGLVVALSPPPTIPSARPDLAPLRGHDLACWCPLDQPCHADVLLKLANQ